MPKFLLQVTFNQEAAKRLIEDNSCAGEISFGLQIFPEEMLLRLTALAARGVSAPPRARC
jgi:hypothetical protein